MTTQYGQLEGYEKIKNKVIRDEVHNEVMQKEVIHREVKNNEVKYNEVKYNEVLDQYQQNLNENLDFVNEMKSAILEDWRKAKHDYFIIESRKKDLEKILQNLLQQEDKAGALFIPSEHNENKKEQDLILEELQLVEEQQKRKQEILEQKELKVEKMSQLYQYLKSIDLLLHQIDRKWNFESSEGGEEVILKNSFDSGEEKKDIQKDIDITESDLKESVPEENIPTESISEGRNIEKIAAGVEERQEKGIREEKKEEATALLAMQEYERKRIAREMHDSTVQDLTTLIHRIELVEKLIDMDIVRAKMELATLKEIVKKSVDEMRNIIYDLHPVQIEEFGLKAMLQKFVAKIKDEYKISVNLSAEDDRCEDHTVNLALYRIIQEACNNSIRYSEATKIMIELKYMEHHIHLVIEDNGLGFDMEEVQKKAMSEGRGFGLSLMKERVYLLSGKFDISSASGAGTKITVIIPRLV